MDITGYLSRILRRMSDSFNAYLENAHEFYIGIGLDGVITPVFPDDSQFIKNDAANVPGTLYAAGTHGNTDYSPVVPAANLMLRQRNR